MSQQNRRQIWIDLVHVEISREENSQNKAWIENSWFYVDMSAKKIQSFRFLKYFFRKQGIVFFRVQNLFCVLWTDSVVPVKGKLVRTLLPMIKATE